MTPQLTDLVARLTAWHGWRSLLPYDDCRWGVVREGQGELDGLHRCGGNCGGSRVADWRRVTQRALGLQTVFLHDALATLGLEKKDPATTLHPCLQAAASHLKDGTQRRLVWQSLSDSLADLIQV